MAGQARELPGLPALGVASQATETPPHSWSPLATHLPVCPSFCSSRAGTCPAVAEAAQSQQGALGSPHPRIRHNGTTWPLTWMILVLDDLVFSCQLALYCALCKSFLALSEPLWQ